MSITFRDYGDAREFYKSLEVDIVWERADMSEMTEQGHMKAGNLLKDYISRDDLAAQIGKSVKTLVRWEIAGRGPPVTRIGRDALYSISSFEKWLKAQECDEALK